MEDNGCVRVEDGEKGGGEGGGIKATTQTEKIDSTLCSAKSGLKELRPTERETGDRTIGL